jgi:transcriptional regulator MraZ
VDQCGIGSATVFFGTFSHAIDAKGRTSLPAKFREALAVANEPKIVLTQYPHWRAVQALPLSEWKRLEERLMQASPLDLRAQKNILHFYSTAHEVDLDVHGRVLVPPALREFAALSKDVVWVGMGRHMHLFDKAVYEEQMSKEMGEGEVVDFFKGV